MKKINIATIFLILYTVVFGVIGWPGNKPDPDYIQYFFMMGLTLVIIGILRYVWIKRLRIREKIRQEKEDKRE